MGVDFLKNYCPPPSYRVRQAFLRVGPSLLEGGACPPTLNQAKGALSPLPPLVARLEWRRLRRMEKEKRSTEKDERSEEG